MSEMATIPREVVERALELLDDHVELAHLASHNGEHVVYSPRQRLATDTEEARDALHAALAAGEARQVPVAWHYPTIGIRWGKTPPDREYPWMPLFAAPPQPAEPVVTDEMVEMACAAFSGAAYGNETWREAKARSMAMHAALVAAMGAKP